MNYELLKQLADAGFPKDMDFREAISDSAFIKINGRDVRVCADYETQPRYANPPTLSELIKACVDGDFILSTEFSEGAWVAGMGNKSSVVRLGESEPTFIGAGKTPEEAVAKLWLALNSK